MIELLLATTLTAMLMVGVLAVLGNMMKAAVVVDRDAGSGFETEAEAVDALVRMVGDDLRHANTVFKPVTSDDVTMLGYGALDANAREPMHRPVSVIYRVETLGGRSWLVRRQAVLDVLTNQNVQRDAVFEGVRRFEIVQTALGEEGEMERVSLPAEPKAQRPVQIASGGAASGGAIGGVGDSIDRANDRPDDDIYVESLNLHYYREYVPAWAHQEKGIASGGPTGATISDLAAEGGVSTPEQAEEAKRLPLTVWHLRIWTDDSAEPTIDRRVSIRMGEGA